MAAKWENHWAREKWQGREWTSLSQQENFGLYSVPDKLIVIIVVYPNNLRAGFDRLRKESKREFHSRCIGFQWIFLFTKSISEPIIFDSVSRLKNLNVIFVY